MARGNIMAAVAVLLTHMDKNAVTENKYMTATNKLPFANAIILLAIILSNC